MAKKLINSNDTSKMQINPMLFQNRNAGLSLKEYEKMLLSKGTSKREQKTDVPSFLPSDMDTLTYVNDAKTGMAYDSKQDLVINMKTESAANPNHNGGTITNLNIKRIDSQEEP